MKITIFSDVHGNLPAFRRMLEDAGPCDAYVCLGDLVNYGPWSNECVDLAVSLPDCTLIMGNHEEAFIAGEYPGNNKLVRKFFDICYPGFQKTGSIKKFASRTTIGKFVLTHTILNSYIFPDTTVTLDRNYIIGHSHHQFVYHNNGFVLYNAGSVGQNRQFINVINYLVLDSVTEEVACRELINDVDEILFEMRRLRYPEDCINYYASKPRKQHPG